MSSSDAILSLHYLQKACNYVEALVSAVQVMPLQEAQIALRSPKLGEPREPLGTEWHMDGMWQRRLHPFTWLVGIALLHVLELLCINLIAFPGSHALVQSCLAADGKLYGYDDECYKADSVCGNGTLPDLGTPSCTWRLVLAQPNLAH